MPRVRAPAASGALERARPHRGDNSRASRLRRVPAGGSRHRHPGPAPVAEPDRDRPMKEVPAVTATNQQVSVRYIVDDVQAAVDFYTTHLGFTLNLSAAPAFADVLRGPL